MNGGQSGLLQKEIAERQEIPLKYLDKIVSELRTADLLINVSGKKSGYLLARSPSEISVYDVYRAFEGKLTIIQCVNEAASCCHSEQCASQEFWNKLNLIIEDSMMHTTLDHLAIRQQEFDMKKMGDINFQI